MNILHIASHLINVGDGALNRVIQRYLEPNNVVKMDVHGSHEYFLTNSDYDKVVVGGGGGIYGLRTPLRFPVFPCNLQDNMAFVALGHNQFYGDKTCDTELALLINECKERGIPFSVREDGSAGRILKTVGAEVEEIPDPGLFVEVDDNYRSPCIRNGINVIFQVAGDSLDKRFVSKDDYAGFIMRLAQVATKLIKKYDANIVLAPHITRDLGATNDLVASINSIYGDIVREHITITPIVGPNEADKYFTIYRDADLVIGMRGHSVICGVGLGTPTIGIDSHPKIRGFMEHYGLGGWLYNYGVIYEQCCYLLDNKNVQTPDLVGARKRLDSFMARVVN